MTKIRLKTPGASITVRSAVAAILGASAIYAMPLTANAQTQKPQTTDVLEEVTVTGSRIARRDLESNSPLVVVDAGALENRSGLNIESYLNQLPTYNPSFSPVTTQGDVQISAVNSVGISAVSLRGFGPNRNLVLIDGHRPTPINALMVTDLNGIPSAMVKKVEIISGGASAVYGADALGGVTNFLMRDDFQGVEVDASYGKTMAGDGQETRQSLTMGTNFDSSRGNITMSIEHYKREEAFEKNRDFYTKSWSDPSVPSNDLFVFGYNGYNAAFSFNPPSGAALNTILQTPPTTGNCGYAGGAPCNIFFGLRFIDGHPASLVGDNLARYTASGGKIDGSQFAIQNVYDGTIAQQGQVIKNLKWNNPDAYVSAPQERFSFFASGKYDITDDVKIFARTMYAESETRTRLFGANASFGWEASIPYNPTTDSPILPTLPVAQLPAAVLDPTNPLYRNPGFIAHGTADPDGTGPLLGAQHPVPVEWAALLNSRPNPAAPWIAETYPQNSFDQRSTVNTSNVWQIETGLQFNLPVKDWTGELYYSHGQSMTYNVAYGNNSLSRWRAAAAALDYGRNASFFGNSTGASVNFGTVPVPCTSGFYETLFMSDAKPSQDCIYAVSAPLQTRSQNIQDIAELNFQGGLFNLPAGEVRGSLGVSYRENSSLFNPDILQSTASFTDQVIGVYPTGYLDKSLNVREVYGELLVPVLSDLPFLKKLELELGGRHSEYSVTDSTDTFKALANIQVNDSFRLRGGFNRATRAPNLGELYLNLQEIFTGDGRFGDPCGVRSNSPFGAGGSANDPVLTGSETNPPPIASGQTAAGAASTKLICEAQMGGVGSPGYNGYYGPTVNAPAAGGGVFAWVYQQGNPNLKSETADTVTVGFVLTSPFSSAWIKNFTVSVDYFQVDIKDAIQQYSVDYARSLCYGSTIVTNATEAAAQAATLACKNVARSISTGGALTTTLQYDNQATISTSGFDVAINWQTVLADLGMGNIPGSFGVNVQSTILNSYKTKQSAFGFDPETEWVGSLGPNLTGTNPGAYTYRLNVGFNYSINTLNFNLGWRHLPSVAQVGQATEDAIRKNNAAVAGGSGGTMLSYTPGTFERVAAYDIFDLTGSWGVTDTITLRAGVTNLFDQQPPVVGATRGNPYNPSLPANGQTVLNRCSATEAAQGCQNPTGYSLPNNGSGLTSPGYYDVYGRAYYAGVKVKF